MPTLKVEDKITTSNSTFKGKEAFDLNTSFTNTFNANRIYDKDTIRSNRFNKFSRFGFFDLYDTGSINREYIFFTKMDLHLFDPGTLKLQSELSNIPFFAEAAMNHPNTMIQLQSSCKDDYNNPFCNLLTNSVRSRVELEDISIDKLETGENLDGTKFEYPLTHTGSSIGVNFNLEFQDTKFLDVYMFFRIWYEYQLLKRSGSISHKEDHFRDYIINKILYDQMAVYKIIVGEDMETIVHWTKYWGVYPTVIPRGTFSDLPENEAIRFSVSFYAQFVEDMDPSILTDFNILTQNRKNAFKKDKEIYNVETALPNGQWCNIPYIKREYGSNGERYNQNRKFVYKLKWR